MKYYIKATLYVLWYAFLMLLLFVATTIVAKFVCETASKYGVLGWFVLVWNSGVLVYLGYLIAGYSGKLDRK
jgi:hypothetical protein